MKLLLIWDHNDIKNYKAFLYVLKELGFTLISANIIHINSSYVRDDTLELDKLFTIADVTQEVVDLQISIPPRLKEFETVLADKINESNIDIEKHCHNPYVCDAKDYCWKMQTHKYSIFNLFNLGNKKSKFKLKRLKIYWASYQNYIKMLAKVNMKISFEI